MATSANLLIQHIEQSQSGKEVSINEAIDILDRAVAGLLSKSITGADVTLTSLEAQNGIVHLTGTLTGNRNLIVPARTKLYVVYNNTSGAFTVTIKTASGTGVVVDQGARQWVYCDGTNVVSILTGSSSVITGYKAPCRAATTGNITLSGAQTIDGVSVIAGERVLVKDQSTASQNGIYVCASGAWARATDFDSDAEVIGGTAVAVSEGTANGNKLFLLTTNDPITVGSTGLTFAAISAGGGGGDSTYKNAFGSRTSPANDGDLFFPTDGFTIQRDTGAAWEPWGPLFPFTKPPAVASWTWVNQGGAAASDVADGVVLTAPANSGESWRILKKTAPATPYTIVMAFLPCLVGQNAVSAGFLWRQSSDGKLVSIARTHNSEWKFDLVKWNSATSFSASYVSLRLEGVLVWLRLQDDGTNRIVSVSQDGQTWRQVQSIGRTDFLTADEIGFGINVNNATYPAALTLLHWKES